MTETHLQPNEPVSELNQDIAEVLLSRERIQKRVGELGAAISRDYRGKDLLMIGVLRGVLFFMADLLRAITIPVSADFIAISHYGPSERTRGVVRLVKDLEEPIDRADTQYVQWTATGMATGGGHFAFGTLTNGLAPSPSAQKLPARWFWGWGSGGLLQYRSLAGLNPGPIGLTHLAFRLTFSTNPYGSISEDNRLKGSLPLGQLNLTTEVENFPGFPEKVRGTDLMQRMRDQAEHQGVEFITADVTKVDFSKRPFLVWTDEPEPLQARAVIIATGARANYIGIASEDKLKNKGVSACAVCDGALYRGADVAVVGGGDTAMEEAAYLAGLCRSVTLIHRRDEFRASKTMQTRVLSNPKIKVIYNHVVDEVLDVSKDEVTGLRLRNVKTGELNTITVKALFVAIGHTPNTELFRGQLELHANDYIKTIPGTTQTSIKGVFAAGDVQDWVYRQAVTAAGTGCMAALEAERLLGAEGGH